MAEMKEDLTSHYKEEAEKHAEFLVEKLFKPAFIMAFIHGAKHGREDVLKEQSVRLSAGTKIKSIEFVTIEDMSDTKVSIGKTKKPNLWDLVNKTLRKIKLLKRPDDGKPDEEYMEKLQRALEIIRNARGYI